MKREMISISVGALADQYHANTHSRLSMGWLNHQQKKCAGPCKMPRSVGQFAPGDDLCARCRRRA